MPVSPVQALGPDFYTTPTVQPGSRPIQLGAILFSTEETPELLPIPTEQMLVVHNLPGGSIITNDFGNKPGDISWSGKFFGPNIEPRVKQLREYKMAGQVIPFAYGDEQYYVRIKSFDPGYRGGYNDYSITLVVTGAGNGAFNVPSTTDLDQQVQNLMAMAVTSYNNVLNVDPNAANGIGGPLSNLQAILTELIPLVASLATGGASIQSAITELLIVAQQYESSLSPTAAQIADLTVMISSVQAMLNGVTAGVVTGTMPVYGGDLFSVAAMQYGDVSQAFPLANANGRVYPLMPPGLRKSINIVPLTSTVKVA